MTALIKSSFAPVVREDTRLIVLGSLPGEVSLVRAQYYAHPRNHFWRLIGAVIEADLAPLPYPQRLDALLGAHVGLWDVVHSAEREGSLDGNIRGALPNALAELVRGLPELKGVAFNGGTSARIGAKALAGEQGLALLPLPSSSPAYTLPFDAKLEEWLKLRQFL